MAILLSLQTATPPTSLSPGRICGYWGHVLCNTMKHYEIRGISRCRTQHPSSPVPKTQEQSKNNSYIVAFPSKVSLSDAALYSEVRLVQMNCHLSGGRVMGNLPILPILMPARARARNAD